MIRTNRPFYSRRTRDEALNTQCQPDASLGNIRVDGVGETSAPPPPPEHASRLQKSLPPFHCELHKLLGRVEVQPRHDIGTMGLNGLDAKP